MAHYFTGTAVGAGAAASLMTALDTNLVANGWTSHDVIGAGTDVVYKSTALDATAGNAAFMRVTKTSTTAIDFRVYMDWDTSTHAGVNVTGDASGTTRLTVQDASFTYYMRVNSAAILVVAVISGTYNKIYAGFLRRTSSVSRSGMTKTTSLYALGVSTMALASDMTTKWQVGQSVHIVNFAHASGNANAANVEVMVIQSITSNSVTFTGTTTKAYDSGALVGEHVLPVTVCAGFTTVPATCYFPTSVAGLRTSATAHTATCTEATISSDAPSTTLGTYAIAYMSVISSSQSDRGIFYHMIFVKKGSAALLDTFSEGTDTAIVLGSGTNLVVGVGPQN
jgi:hypothetical protein